MHFSTTFLISALPLLAAASIHESPFRSRHRSTARHVGVRAGRTFTREDHYQGESFLNEWDFFSEADPTHGSVNYQTKENAIAKGLAYVQEDGTTVLAVDDKTQLAEGKYRDSVRISSRKKYNGGLFIADFWSMPHGCGTWPAYWSVGPKWPENGEIDLIEGVHEQEANQYTLHATTGCSLSKETSASRFNGSNIVGTKCASADGDNSGCFFVDSDSRSYGSGFNKQAGGVVAHLWDGDGIAVWFFSRSEIPADVTAGNPDPSGWGQPKAFFANSDCNVSKYFSEHGLTINTSLCGDYAGGTYSSAGCPGTCAQAVANPDNFKYAKWKINYIDVYN